MIALTQERKIALIEHADEIKDRLSEYGYPFQPHKTKQLLDIALASLTAEPKVFIHHNMLDSMTGEGGRVCGRVWNSSTDEISNEGRIPLFTASPVPEIKLPDRDKLPGWARNHEDSLGWYESEIKRLNGLGE
ncbi:hypothetical protein SAMN05216522_11313 [Rosenbergiella nectarea]|uniref:Uncharacterized protein n=1 Tax=Rosenbergiella nectarea TaxID=988801 RepID=A0A1H9LZK6_9GAMM|nr:hypothetical protein [Rosenbergiella nectarea]SER16876.1 hypothetical protein SAMN05216522_11313 [Rosenbergiella nectarea]